MPCTFPISTRLVSITIVAQFSCQIIRQKSVNVSWVGPFKQNIKETLHKANEIDGDTSRTLNAILRWQKLQQHFIDTKSTNLYTKIACHTKEQTDSYFLPFCLLPDSAGKITIFSTLPKLKVSIFRHVTPQNVTGHFNEQRAAIFKRNSNRGLFGHKWHSSINKLKLHFNW